MTNKISESKHLVMNLEEKHEKYKLIQKIIIIVGVIISVLSFIPFIIFFLMYNQCMLFLGLKINEIITLIFALCALIYTAFNSQLNTNIRLEQISLAKKENSIKFINESTSKEIANASLVCNSTIDKLKTEKNLDIISLVEGNDELKRSVIFLLNYFERINVLIKYDSADEMILKEYYDGLVQRYYNGFKSWISYRRDVMGISGLYSEVESLCKRWNA